MSLSFSELLNTLPLESLQKIAERLSQGNDRCFIASHEGMILGVTDGVLDLLKLESWNVRAFFDCFYSVESTPLAEIWSKISPEGMVERFFIRGLVSAVSVEIRLVRLPSGQVLGIIIEMSTEEQLKKLLQSSEATFKAVFEQNAIGVGFLTLGGRIVEANDRLCEILGKQRSQILRCSLESFAPEEDQGVIENVIGQLIEILDGFRGARKSVTIEQRYLKNNKEIIWLRITFTLSACTQLGLKDSVLVMIEDVTDLFRQRDELIASAIMWKQMIQNSSDLIGLIRGEDRRIAYVSPSVQKILGYRPSDIEGISILDLVKDSDRKQLMLAFRKWEQGLEYQVNTCHVRSHTSQWQTIEITGQLLENLALGVEIVINARDITARMQTEQQLQSSQETNQALLAAIPDLLIRISSDGIVLDYQPNKTADPLWRHPRRNIGKTLFDLMPHDLASKRMEYVQAAIETKTEQVYTQEIGSNGQTCLEETRIVTCGMEEVLLIIREVGRH